MENVCVKQSEILIDNKVEVKEEPEDPDVWGNGSCKEEEIPEKIRKDGDPEICPSPLNSQDFTKKHHQICYQRKLKNIKTEVTEEEEEEEEDLYGGTNGLCKEEEVPVEISIGEKSTEDPFRYTNHHYKNNETNIKTEVKDEDEAVPNVLYDKTCKEEEIPTEISTDPGDTKETHKHIKVKEEKEGPENIKEEDMAIEIGTDGQYIRYNTEEPPPRDNEDDITSHSSEYEDVTSDSSEDEGDVISDSSEDDIASNSSDDDDVTSDSSEENKNVASNSSAEDDDVTSDSSEVNKDVASDSSEEDDEDVTSDSSEENVASVKKCITPNVHPAPNSANMKSEPSKCERVPQNPSRSVADPSKCVTGVADPSKHQKRDVADRLADGIVPKTKKKFACSDCDKSYNSKKGLRMHVKEHRGSQPYSCSECGKRYSYKSGYEVHLKTHTGEKPYKCLQCGRRFALRTNLVKHQNIHVAEKPYSCSQCSKSFYHKGSLIAHERTHTPNYICTKKRHTEKLFSCPDCGKGFAFKLSLDKHQKNRSCIAQYSCAECGRDFKRKSSLLVHKDVHRRLNLEYQQVKDYWKRQDKAIRDGTQTTYMRERPFSCPDCGKSFASKPILAKHRKSHTAVAQFSCNDCGKSFTAKASLDKHEKNRSCIAQFSCAECGRVFKRQANLVVHKDVHRRLNLMYQHNQTEQKHEQFKSLPS